MREHGGDVARWPALMRGFGLAHRYCEWDGLPMSQPSRPPRFPPLSMDEMTPAQREAAEGIRSGPRVGLRGPFQAWLRAPRFADLMQRVGAHLRFETSVPARLNELAILITARAWDAQFEWWAHERLAREAGLDPRIGEAIAEGRRPEPMRADEAVVYDFCTELRATRKVSDATLARALGLLSEQGVIEL